MDFINLKESLKKEVLQSYYLHGNDIYVLYSSLRLITKAASGEFGDFNTIVFTADDGATASDIVRACLSLPIGDGKRLVIVKGSKVKKTDKVLDELVAIIKNPPESLCLVFFAADKCDIFDAVKSHCNEVNCDKLPTSYVISFIEAEVKKGGAKIIREEANLICDLCGGELGKIYGELNKLCLLANGGQITKELIDEQIEKDYEYIVFQLGDKLGKKDAGAALPMLEALLADKEVKNYILSSLYSLFSRALFASVTQDDELVAKELKTKPFAVSKAKEISENFSQSALRKVCGLILEAEESFKTGQTSLDDAVLGVVCKILS